MKNIPYLQLIAILIFSSFIFPNEESVKTNKQLKGTWKFSKVQLYKIDKKRFSFPESYLKEKRDESLFGCSLISNPKLEFNSDSTMTVICKDTFLTKYHYGLNNKELRLYKSDYVIFIPVSIKKYVLTFIENENGFRKVTYFNKE